MEGLGIDLRLIVVQIINFGLLLFLLKRFLYKPILKSLDDRKKKIAESLDRAQKIEEEWVKLEEKKKEALQKAKEAGRELVESARSAGDRERSEIVARAKEEAERMVARAKEQLDLEREKLRGEIKTELADLSIALSEKFMEEKIGKEEKEKFVIPSLDMLRKKAQSVSFSEGITTFGKKKVSPQSEKIAMEFLTLLKKSQNLKLLPEIVSKLEVQINIPAQVITAAALKTEDQQKIRGVLGEIYGGCLKINFRVEPKIIGGIIVTVGDEVFDNSLLGKTQKLRESL